MVTTHEDVARAFSGHRFDEAFGHLAPDVRWVLVGDRVIVGRDAVEAACRATMEGLADVTETFRRFISTSGGDVAMVDAVGVYDGPHGVTAVSSCDIYEFSGDSVVMITSYTVEVDADMPGADEAPEVPDAPADPRDPAADPGEPLNPA